MPALATNRSSRPELALHARHRLPLGGEVPHVEREGEHAAGVVALEARGGLGQPGLVAAVDRHRHALAQQCLGDRKSDPAARPGDQRHLGEAVTLARRRHAGG